MPGCSVSSNNFSGYKIELLAGESVLATQQNSFVPLPGTFQDATLVFNANTNTVPTNPLGRALTIRLSSNHNPSGSTASTVFDNVRLTVAPIPPVLSISRNANQAVIRSPANYIGWRLQVQTNSITAGFRDNWADVAGSTIVDNVNFNIEPANRAVFFRMFYPRRTGPGNAKALKALLL